MNEDDRIGFVQIYRRLKSPERTLQERVANAMAAVETLRKDDLPQKARDLLAKLYAYFPSGVSHLDAAMALDENEVRYVSALILDIYVEIELVERQKRLRSGQ